MDSIAAAISSSVEEQGGTTREIARSVQEAATGNQEVTARINQVSSAADESGRLAVQVRSNADDVTASVNSLQQDITAAIRQSVSA